MNFDSPSLSLFATLLIFRRASVARYLAKKRRDACRRQSAMNIEKLSLASRARLSTRGVAASYRYRGARESCVSVRGV